jgi:hypothetical protein
MHSLPGWAGVGYARAVKNDYQQEYFSNAGKILNVQVSDTTVDDRSNYAK